MSIHEIVMFVIIFVLGGLSIYLKAKSNLLLEIEEKIIEAENLYKDVTQAGAEKFNYVVDSIYSCLPSGTKKVFTEEVIGNMVQQYFGLMEKYATILLDKATDQITKKE
jgi:hypothetical protein